MKSNRRMLVFDHLDSRVGMGTFVQVAVPIANITELTPVEPQLVEPWIHVRTKVQMKDGGYYYSKQTVEHLVMLIESSPINV